MSLLGLRTGCLSFRVATNLPRASRSRPLRYGQTIRFASNSALTRTIYRGPLTNTFKYLKIFSLSSLVLSSALSPFIFILESSLPMSGRIVLATAAISTTTISTVLISTFTAPYVTSIQAHPAQSSPSHTLYTTDILLRPIKTSIASTEMLVPSERPLTTWKLVEEVADDPEAGGDQRIAAWTEGKGRWVLEWDQNGKGSARADGKVARYFNVHPELLGEPMTVGQASQQK